MSLAVTYSRANRGIDAPLVSVETHLANGLPGFTIVGLPEAAVRESRDRVRSAILNSHFDFPARRITVNLAPADLPKEGSRFDLAIAIGILAASEQLPGEQLGQYEFVGELALSGDLRGVRGILPALIRAGEAQRSAIIPTANSAEAQLPMHCESYIATHILEVCAHINGRKTLAKPTRQSATQAPPMGPDLADVKGQPQARRALEIAAAGGHNLLLVGPPGTGKTMLAARLSGLMPPLSRQTALDVASIHSLAGTALQCSNWRRHPFRRPHHSASPAAMVGGGSHPRPGEISLAHGGILFLDELPEFDRRVLEALREPIETGSITLSRVNQRVEFPARFQLVAAMNPCPCGFWGDSHRSCQCSPVHIQRYRNKLSGPLLDRFDLLVTVNRPPTSQLFSACATENSHCVRQRVQACRERQRHRGNTLNAQLDGDRFTDPQVVDPAALQWLSETAEKLALSARAFYRILRVSRTIADLESSDAVQHRHIKEALLYRREGK